MGEKRSFLAWMGSHFSANSRYTHLSNGLMHVVVEGYEKYSREEVARFVNRIVQCSLSQFQ